MKLLKEMTKRQSPVWTSIALGAMATFVTVSMEHISFVSEELDGIVTAVTAF